VITFQNLLKIFWEAHDPCSSPRSTQYKAVLWTHGAEQAKAARTFVAAWEQTHGREVATRILPAPRFWIAEDYHQKFGLRSKKALLHSLFDKPPTDEQIRESTVTARVNGWIAGYGTAEEIEAQATALGLSQQARRELKVLGRRAPKMAQEAVK
jgi:peptide-methionine (S)-S-oxide reductase